MTLSIREFVRNNLKGDRQIWWIVLFLSILSVLVVYSATGTIAYQKMGGNTEAYLLKHGALVVLGLVCMFLAHRVNYIHYARLAKYGLWLSVPLLIWAYFKGTNLNDASRWITMSFCVLYRQWLGRHQYRCHKNTAASYSASCIQYFIS